MKTITISEETYERIKDQLAVDDNTVDSYDDLVGNCYFFRAVTYHMVGRVVKTMGHFLELSDASWVADSGRFMNAIKEGKLNEVEPVGRAWLNINTVVDFFPWVNQLPDKQI